MEAIPLHRVAVVRPFTQFLAELGAPVEKGLQQAKLPVLALDNVNAYVPSLNFWAFVGHMARHEGIDDLGFLVGKRFGANCIDPDFSRLLSRSPTLYHGLQTTCRLAAKTISRSRVSLSRSPADGSIRFIHRASFDASHPYLGQMDWYGIMVMIGIVRQFAGRDWQPKEIGLTLPHPPVRSIREQLQGTRLLYSQGQSCITIEASLLSLPPVTRSSEVSGATPVLDIHPDDVSVDFAGSIKQALGAYMMDGKPTVELAADLCSTSTRSLQRKLIKSGTTFSGLIDQIYFDAASNMLHDHDTKVSDIAHALCFDDASHFSRSFRRIAGISPREFRKQAM